ncbi:hypothetical protein ACJRO7_002614 [Eucalyptus globulus]|uniref:Uncharacterized protein n=1 Tax=Eucalyptus globulus TaxID=34317 RepID=A0ABD3LV15_EUCGL
MGGSSLEGKVALITGGASGITARFFAHHGAKVVIGDVNDSLGQSVQDSLGQDTASYVHCDVTDESQIKVAVAEAVSAYGELDILFNNVGIADPIKACIIDNDKADFEHVLAVNVTSVFLGVKHTTQAMILARPRSAGADDECCHGAGVVRFRVNCRSPYACATPLAAKFVGLGPAEMEAWIGAMGNLKGVTLKAEDVANAALFLASDEARYVNSHNLFIDGGFSVVNPSFHMFQYPPEEA